MYKIIIHTKRIYKILSIAILINSVSKISLICNVILITEIVSDCSLLFSDNTLIPFKRVRDANMT